MDNKPEKTEPPKRGSLNYRDAGVDIDAAGSLIEYIKPLAARTARPGVLAGLGGFGALFEIPTDRYREPVLVSGTDGVGTKLKLALQAGKHDTIGIDLVAMCVNDLLVQGAEPLFFLDYYATGKLDVSVARQVIAGIADGCELAGAALIGGETAEMPGMYHGDDYDLAGFCVGIVEKSKIIDGRSVTPGDALIGIASSGPHSNGYSLIRHILDRTGTALDTPLGGRSLGEALLEPTRIYVRAVLGLCEQVPVRALAHITGGGLLDNLPRVLPPHTRAVIDAQSWPEPEVFAWLRTAGDLDPREMYRTFNCGIGMVVCVPATRLADTLAALKDCGETAWHIGAVTHDTGEQPQVQINNPR